MPAKLGLGFQVFNVKIEATIEIGSCLGLKSAINIKLTNLKSISLHQELTLLPAPRPNVRTNIIDQIYIKRYKKYLYYHWWAYNVLGHSHVEGNARIIKRKRFPQMAIQSKLTYIPTSRLHINPRCHTSMEGL
jgi:hypothetical protein